MPVDFQSYLLSSSPPGFELDAYSSMPFFKLNGFDSSESNSKSRQAFWPSEPPSTILGNEDKGSFTNERNVQRILCWEKNYDSSVSVAKSRLSIESHQPECKKGTKKVLFADDIGLALEEVRIMTESSDTPPTFQTDVLARLKLGCSTSFSVEPLSYMFSFSQPASDYLSLRNKVEANKVSLESVTAKDHSMTGTVRVKNIAFQKKVFIRFTHNDWITFKDIAATYVVGSSPGTRTTFDKFTFEVNFPVNLTESMEFQFAIYFEADDKVFWDNNNGQNYKVISTKQNTRYSLDDKAVFSLHHENSWTEFSDWDEIGPHNPYW